MCFSCLKTFLNTNEESKNKMVMFTCAVCFLIEGPRVLMSARVIGRHSGEQHAQNMLVYIEPQLLHCWGGS